jgi:hypothetical protein
MLTKDDIQQITNAQIEAQKEIFFTKEEMDEKFYSKPEMDEKFKNLQTSIDAIAKDNNTKNQEFLVQKDRIKKVENWVDKAAPKIGVKFEH